MHKNLEVHERCTGLRKFKAFLDLDCAKDASDASIDAIISAMDFLLSDDDLSIARIDRADKRSLHVVSKTEYMSGMVAYGKFLTDMAEYLQLNEHYESVAHIDKIKSSKTFGLRMPLHSKHNVDNSALRIVKGEYSDFWLQTNEIVFCTYNMDESASIRAINQSNDLTVATAMAEWQPIYGNQFRFDTGLDLSKSTNTFKRYAPGFCASCNRDHTNRDAFMTIDPDGSALLWCSAGGTPLHKVMADISIDQPIIDDDDKVPIVEAPKVEYVKPPMPAPDEHDAMANSPSEDAEIIDSRYNSDVLVDKRNQDLYLISAPGTGKNHYIKGVIEVARKLNPKVKILAITARKTLSIQTCESLGLTNYDTIKGKLNTNFNPQSVFQLESLKRINVDTKFDIILMDEYSLSIAHAYSETGGSDDTNKGIVVMRQLLAICGRSIILDADITQAQISEVQKIRQSPGRVVLNTHKKWSDCIVDIQTGKHSIAYVRSDLWENTTKQQELMLANQPYNGSLVSCHSLKECRASYTQACEKYGKEHFVMYSSETSEIVKRDDFKNASVAWAGKLIVFFTQTVSCGIYVNIPHFNRTYGFFSNTTTSVDQTIQSLLRGRQVKNIMISYVGRDQYLPQTRRDVIEQCVQAEFNHNIPDSMRSDRNGRIELLAPNLKTTTNADDLDSYSRSFAGQLWIGEALAANRSKLYFVDRMERSFGIMGAPVSVTKTQKPVEKSPEGTKSQ